MVGVYFRDLFPSLIVANMLAGLEAIRQIYHNHDLELAELERDLTLGIYGIRLDAAARRDKENTV